MIDVVFEGGQDAVDFQLGILLADRYVLLQTRLDEASDDLDDATKEPRRAAPRGERLIVPNDAAIDDACARLTA